MTAGNWRRCVWGIVAVAACATAALAGAPPITTQATASAAATLPSAELASPGFWPDLQWPTVCWLAAVVILALTIRLRPLLSLRNLDGLVLAGASLLFALRNTAGNSPWWPQTWPWWAYAGLTAVSVYFLLRGIGLLLSTKGVLRAEPVSDGARLVLLTVALALCIQRIATAPVSAGSRDGLVGGIYPAASGKLPYGDAPEFEGRSPLLYLLHAGAVRVVEPTLIPAGAAIGRPMTWENRSWWLAEPWVESANLVAARLVNAVLFVVLLIGLCVIGRRWQVLGADGTMLAVFCIFPGTLECLAHPAVMLPAALLTWTLAFAFLPALGGLLATLCLVLAGVASPWAWLGLPVLLAHFWRRGWQALGSTVGLLAGVAACVGGLAWLVQPAMPRTNGALHLAGLQPLYSTRLADQETVVLDRRNVPSEDIVSPALSSRVWRFLIESESAALKNAEQPPSAVKIDWPNGVTANTVLYRQLDVARAVLPLVQTPYREAIGQMPDATRLLVAARTVLEATWVPAHAAEPTVEGAWQLWGGPPPMTERWVLIRRIVKSVVGLLTLWATLAVFVGRRARPRHLLATLLMVASGTLLASEAGAATNWVWLLPLVTAIGAVHEPAPPAPVRPVMPRSASPLPDEAPPRITIESPPLSPPP